jgi:hypothetical protein
MQFEAPIRHPENQRISIFNTVGWLENAVNMKTNVRSFAIAGTCQRYCMEGIMVKFA